MLGVPGIKSRLHFQFSCVCPRKQRVMAQVLGDLDGVPDSWLWPGPVPAIAGISGVNQQMED